MKNNIKNAPVKFQEDDVSKGLINEFETAVVNDPSVFESLKFYCISCSMLTDNDEYIWIYYGEGRTVVLLQV